MPNEIPPFLNYTRSIAPSEGMIFGLVEGVAVPVEVIRRGIRGTMSHYRAAYSDTGDAIAAGAVVDNISKEAERTNANLQVIESAFLPFEADRLALRFSVVVQANSLQPSGCDSAEFFEAISNVVSAYRDAGGFQVLAERYAWNLVNGRTLWRNRFVADLSTKITIDGTSSREPTTIVFDGSTVDLRKYESAAMPEGFHELASAIEGALSGRDRPLFLTVEVSGRMPSGAELFPSQEFIPDGEKGAKEIKDVGRILSSIQTTYNGRPIRQATLHSQKIGNALRTIDEWHSKVQLYGATSVDVFGPIHGRADATRQTTTGDSAHFYALLKRLDEIHSSILDSDGPEAIPGSCHFLVAMLIRGGVFSGPKKGSGSKVAKKKGKES